MSSDPSPNSAPAPTIATNAPVANVAASHGLSNHAGSTGPTPLQIGRSFIKQYYKTLSSSPSQMHKFYQSDSTVSRGMEPSSLTDTSLISDVLEKPAYGEDESSPLSPGERVCKSFFEWAGRGTDEIGEDAFDVLRIDFERGAIDAQESVGGGILLVVTAHMFLPDKPLKGLPFVQTFFLNNGAPPGRKRQFYVKNDVLRFLSTDGLGGAEKVGATVEPEKTEEVAIQATVSPTPAQTMAADAAEPKTEEPTPKEAAPVPELVEEQPELSPETANDEREISPPLDEGAAQDMSPSVGDVVTVEDSTNETTIAPLGQVEPEPQIDVAIDDLVVEETPVIEEEKHDVIGPVATSLDSPATSPTSEGKRGGGSKRNRRRKGGKSSRSNSPQNGFAEIEEEAPTNSDGTKTIKEDSPSQLEQPKKPGSWASLVAGGSAPPLQAKNTEETPVSHRKGTKNDQASRRAPPKGHHDEREKPPANHDPAAQNQHSRGDRAHKESIPNASSSTAASPQLQIIQNQRTPDATLFIRNIPDATKESEIRALFEPHGITTGNKILGVTLSASRGFCFVDFDGPAAVVAIVAEAQKSLVKDSRTGRKVESSFMVHGRVLDVEKKVVDGRKSSGGMGSGGGGRRYNRSRSPKDGGGRYGSRGSRGSGMRRSPPPRDGGRRTSGGGGGGSANR